MDNQQYRQQIKEMVESGEFSEEAIDGLNLMLEQLDFYENALLSKELEPIKKLLASFEASIAVEEEILKNQIIKTDEDVKERYATQAKVASYRNILSSFSTQGYEQLVSKIKENYDYFKRKE